MSLSVQLSHQMKQFKLDLAFDLPAKGLTALFGPSGAGKSLTINAIAGLITPQEGQVQLNGETLFSSSAKINRPTHKRNIAYMFQDSRLFPHLTIKKNLLFGAKRCQQPPSKQEINHLIDLLDIGHLLDRHPGRLSGGEKQRVALGRALLSNPSLLLLDEPMAALDQGRKHEILPHLERLRDESNIPILYISHSISEVARLADEMLLISEGKLAAKGPVHDVMNRLDLFPLTGRFEAGTAFVATILSHDIDNGMSEVQFDGGTLWTSNCTSLMPLKCNSMAAPFGPRNCRAIPVTRYACASAPAMCYWQPKSQRPSVPITFFPLQSLTIASIPTIRSKSNCNVLASNCWPASPRNPGSVWAFRPVAHSLPSSNPSAWTDAWDKTAPVPEAAISVSARASSPAWRYPDRQIPASVAPDPLMR